MYYCISPVIDQIKLVSKTNATVMLRGESGVGKEVAARLIHDLSPRKNKPFIAVNCGAIPNELIESEFFGYEKGAFTGATTSRKGKFELANGGTIFLDEIGDLPLQMQVKILRVLQDGQLYKLGSEKETEINIRIISATNKNIDEMVKLGSFRHDLFYRLHVFPIYIPQIMNLKHKFNEILTDIIKEKSLHYGATVSFSKDSLHILQEYNWPGNIRELGNFIERMIILHPNQVVDLDKKNTFHSELIEHWHEYKKPDSHEGNISNKEREELATSPSNYLEHAESISESFTSVNWRFDLSLSINDDFIFSDFIDNVEKYIITKALTFERGVISNTAKKIGMRRTTLTEKMKKHKITASSYKQPTI
ncbi:MAG: sigma-54 interaction domain-containing protein [Lactococcus garvieae]